MTEPVERRFLGGTAAAALAGVNPPRWAQPIDVFLELTGQAPARPRTSAMMAMGRLLEEVVADLFTEATGVTLRRPARQREFTCRVCAQDGLPGCSATLSDARPWAGGHLDRWASDGGVFEAKWSQRRDEWGDGHTPETAAEVPAKVPARYAIQVQHYLSVTGRPFAYLAVLLGYGDFRWYYLPRNPEAIARLDELEDRFWHDNVEAGVAPEPDGSEGYSRHLRRTLGVDSGLEAVATPEQQLLARQLHEWLAEQAATDKLVAAAEQRLQASMGTTAKLVGPDFVISWATTKPRLKVEWEDLATELLGMARLPHSVVDLTEHGHEEGSAWASLTKKRRAELVRIVARALELAHEEPGTRPFRPHFDSDEEE
jgi:predicted phage-related endonuclease